MIVRIRISNGWVKLLTLFEGSIHVNRVGSSSRSSIPKTISDRGDGARTFMKLFKALVVSVGVLDDGIAGGEMWLGVTGVLEVAGGSVAEGYKKKKKKEVGW